jgi:hypothetical protein
LRDGHAEPRSSRICPSRRPHAPAIDLPAESVAAVADARAVIGALIVWTLAACALLAHAVPAVRRLDRGRPAIAHRGIGA